MADVVFNTRIQNKIDTYDNWYTANPILLEGELAGIRVPASKGAVAQEPAILYKVGDGSTAFRDLPFISALAADVHDWAKASLKPTYAANEITELDDFIANEVATLDQNTVYKLEYVDGGENYNINLMSKAHDAADSEYALANSINVPKFDDSDLKDRLTALESLVGTESVADQIDTAIDTALKDYMTETEVKAEIVNQVASAGHLTREIVVVLPAVGDADPDTIYMIKDATVASGDAYKEYMLIDGAFVQIGDTSVDLEPYAKKTDVAEDIADAKAEAISDANDYTDTTVEAAITALGIGDYAKQEDLDTLADRVTEAESDIEALGDEIDGLATVAKTGNVADLLQTQGSYVVFNCGSATVNV